MPDRNLVSDGGFNGSDVGGASTRAPTSPSTRPAPGGATAFEGSGYLATNTSATGGSVYQDIPTSITPGQTFCASMELTTADSVSGGGGCVGASG